MLTKSVFSPKFVKHESPCGKRAGLGLTQMSRGVAQPNPTTTNTCSPDILHTATITELESSTPHRQPWEQSRMYWGGGGGGGGGGGEWARMVYLHQEWPQHTCTKNDIGNSKKVSNLPNLEISSH